MTKKTLSIAYLITRSDAVGGAHIHVLDLASRAHKEGHGVDVWVGGNGIFADMLRNSGLQVRNFEHLVRPIRPANDFLALLRCVQEIKRFKPDILHTHSAKAGLVGRAAAWFAKVPVVFTAHGWAFTEGIAERSRKFAQFLEKMAAHISNSIICVSEYDRKLALNSNVGNAALLTRIHNGVLDIPESLRASHEKNQPVRIVCVARLDAPKRQDLLVDALAKLKDPPWELELIGDGPLTESLKSKVKAYQLENQVIFSGLCHDVPQRLARADISVLISDFEGFPLSILESMRANLPVVASDVGGVSESVIDGITGYLIHNNDNNILVDRLRQLFNDVSLRKKMGNAGRQLYEREFSFEVMYQRTFDIYKRVARI